MKTFLLLCVILPIIAMSQSKVDVFILNKDYTAALKLIDSQLSQTEDAKLYFKKSLVLKKQMQYPESLQQLNLALQLDSLNADYLIEKADICESLGDYDAAVLIYKEALIVNPTDLSTRFSLGQTYLKLTDYKRALEEFEVIFSVDSTNVIYQKYHSLAAYKAGKMDRAIHLYEMYLRLNPNDLSAYLNLSNAYGNKKNVSGGFRVLFRAKNRFPNNSTIDLKLANSFFVNKQYKNASQFYQKYMSKQDTTTAILMNYGICLYHMKNEQEAINTLETCYLKNPNDAYINFYLGVSHKRLGNYDLAAKYLDFSIYISLPEFLPEMYHHLGQVYRSMKEYQKAIDSLNKAYELDDRKVEVLFEIANIYEEFNFNKTMALNYYKNYLLEAGESADNADYALGRLSKIKEELFFEK